MADFTALKTAITNAIKQNGNQAITGNLLQEILIAMVENLGDTALNNLATSIQASLNSLSAEDGNLANAINSEASTRQSADNSLSSAINSEASARSNADSALQQNINTESNQRQSTDANLQNQITTEKNSRIDAVNRLQGLIDAINNVVGNGYTFGGVVRINDAPQQGKMFYIALERGNYINFGGVSVHNGITLIYNNGQWISKELLDLDVFYGEIIRIMNAYQPIVIEGNVTNAPDEEDLTSNNIGLLQFKNKAYAPLVFSGLGRKYLRKNIRPLTDTASFDGFVENVVSEASLSGSPDAIFWDRINERFVGKKGDVYYQDWTDSDNFVPVSSELVYMNEGTPYRWDGTDLVVYDEIYPDLINMLTQDMVNEANTIYHIQYDYDLAGETITIPANCVLEFDGGSLSNGTITGNNTVIEAGLVQIFGTNIAIDGEWKVDEAYPEWFGNDYKKTIDSFHSIKFTGYYEVASSIEIGDYIFNITIGEHAYVKVLNNIDYLFKYNRTQSGTSNTVIGINNRITGFGGIIDCDDKSCFIYNNNQPKNQLILQGLNVRNIGTGSLSTQYGIYLDGGSMVCDNCIFAVRTVGPDTGPEYMVYLQRDDNKMTNTTIVTAKTGIWLHGTNIFSNIHIFGATSTIRDKAYIVIDSGGTNGIMMNNIYFDTPWTCIEAKGGVGPLMLTNLYVLGIYFQNNTTHALIRTSNKSILSSWYGEISYSVLTPSAATGLHFYALCDNNYNELSLSDVAVNIHYCNDGDITLKYDSSTYQYYIGFKHNYRQLWNISNAIRISGTLDLNNYFTDGFYRCPDATNVSNRPTSMSANNGFFMLVYHTSDATQVQEITVTPGMYKYLRMKSGSTISKWYRWLIQDDFTYYGSNPSSIVPTKMAAQYFDNVRNMLYTFDSNNSKWYCSDGEIALIARSGSTGNRPVPSKVGFQYFDTDLGKPIYAKVINTSTTPATVTWVDATGTPV